MAVISAELVRSGPNPSVDLIARQLLSGQTLLLDIPEHLLEVVGILESYGEVLDAYSINLIYQAEHQFLNPIPVFKYFDGDLNLTKLWRHLNHNRINFEYAEYCMKAMLWHGTGGLDAYLDSPEFSDNCHRIITDKRARDPLLSFLHFAAPSFLPEMIRSAATVHALGQFWRVMSDLFLELARAERRREVRSIATVVDFIKQGLIAAAAQPITYGVTVAGTYHWILPPEAGLTFLVDVAVPYVEAVFLRGMPFFGTVSFNAQAQQISSDQSQFAYGALYADPLPTMGAGIPPSLLMQDMYLHLPESLHRFYKTRTRGEGDVHIKICSSFQKSMFCVTNAAINGTMPHSLDSVDPAEQAANHAYALAWAQRLCVARTDCLGSAPAALN